MNENIHTDIMRLYKGQFTVVTLLSPYTKKANNCFLVIITRF